MIEIPDSAVQYLQLQRTGCKSIAVYIDEIMFEFAEISDNIGDPSTVVDIGCGIAGIDVLLWQATRATFYLADRSQLPAIRPEYGFSDDPQHYNSFDIVEQIRRANEIPSDNFKYIHASSSKDLPMIRPDLVISLLSCGYHYPVDHYLDWIVRNMGDHSKLIIDIRDNTDGLLQLRECFGHIEVIHERDKKKRIIARK